MMQTRMNAVCMLHNWCGARNVSLQERIESFDLFTQEEIKSLRFEMRVNRSSSGSGRRISKVVGKTFVTRTICDLWERAGGTLLLAALAGKAALRLSRSTGRLARTIFRTLRPGMSEVLCKRFL